MEQGINISDIVGILKRRFLLIVLITLIGVTASVLVAFKLPLKYAASAKILIESQQIPDDLAKSTVTADAQERLRLIQQRMMSRKNLVDLAQRLELSSSEIESPTEMVAWIRKGVTFHSEVDKEDALGGSTFTILFQSKDPELAAKIANEFASMVVEQNLRNRSLRAAETFQFFKNEAERLLHEIVTLEQRISSFKNDNATVIPENVDFSRRELAGLEQRIFKLDQQKLQIVDEKSALRAELDALRKGLSRSGEPLSPEAEVLRKLRSELAIKLGVYAENHPEIRRLKARILALEQEVSIQPSGDGDGQSQQEIAAGLAETNLERKISQLDSQIDLLDQQRADLDARRQELSVSLVEAPEVNMALTALERRHEHLQAQYQLTIKKKAEAETGERLEHSRQAERFEIIEHAQVPSAPKSPNRKLIAAGGSVAGVALAFGLVALLELTDNRVRTSKDLLRHLELRPIVTVPVIRTNSSRRLRMTLKWGAIFAIATAIAASFFFYDNITEPMIASIKQFFGIVDPLNG